MSNTHLTPAREPFARSAAALTKGIGTMARSIGIHIFRGTDLVDSQIFERDVIKVGRLPSVNLRIDDPKVSRIHGLIEVSADTNDVTFIDMNSAEGTRINGERISRSRLRHGDEIRLGDTKLLVVLDHSELQALRNKLAGVALQETSSGVFAASPAQPFGELNSAPTGMFSTADLNKVVEATQRSAAAPAPSAVLPPVVPATVPVPIELPDESIIEAKSVPPPVAPAMFSATSSNAATTSTTSGGPVLSANAAAGIASPVARPKHSDQVTQVTRPPVAPPNAATGKNGKNAGKAPNKVRYAPIDDGPVTAENRHIEVAVRWGTSIVDIRRLSATVSTKKQTKPTTNQKGKLIVGTVDGVDVFVPTEGLNENPFTLLQQDDGTGSWRVRFTRDMGGTVFRDGIAKPLEKAEAQTDGNTRTIVIDEHTQVHLILGNFTVELKMVARSKFLPLQPFFDSMWANTLVATLFTTMAFFSAVRLWSTTPRGFADDIYKNTAKFQAIMLKPPPKEDDFLKKLSGKQKASAAAKLAEGKAGQKNIEPDKKGAMAAPKTQEKPTDEQVVASKLDALFGDTGKNGIRNVLTGEGSGSALQQALGGISSGPAGASAGAGGLGLRGSGPGGGGTSTNTVGIGKVTAKGRSTGDGTYGDANGGMEPRQDREVVVSQGAPIITGSLDPEIIRRIVRENMQQIRYCYENELTRTPGLYGRVLMRWVINGDGVVTQVDTAETQLKNTNVESCMARKIKGWKFPKPRGGGIVIVNYPFVFKQSG